MATELELLTSADHSEESSREAEVGSNTFANPQEASSEDFKSHEDIPVSHAVCRCYRVCGCEEDHNDGLEQSISPVRCICCGYDCCKCCCWVTRSHKTEDLKLNQGIWALAYVIARNRGGLLVRYCCIISIIYMIQVFSLVVLIWGYSTMLNYDVIVKYEIKDAECEWDEWVEFDNFTMSNMTSFTSIISNMASLPCNSLSLTEEPASTQEYDDSSPSPVLFCASVFLSWCLLSIYILKSLTNPILMTIIGYQYIKPEEKGSDDENHGDDEDRIVCIKVVNRMLGWNAFCGCCCICSYRRNCCSSISCLLYGLSWANIILSSASYITGFVILFGYPFYFGIDSPAEIILTPIGIVFILEIDDWAFEFIKSFYIETEMDDLWILKKSDFRRGSFQRLNGLIWTMVFFLWNLVTFVLGLGLFQWMQSTDSHEKQTDFVANAIQYGFNGVYFSAGVGALVLALNLFVVRKPRKPRNNKELIILYSNEEQKLAKRVKKNDELTNEVKEIESNNNDHNNNDELKVFLTDNQYKVNLFEYYDVFKEQGFEEFDVLKELTDEDLKDDLDINKKAHRIKILRGITILNANMDDKDNSDD